MLVSALLPSHMATPWGVITNGQANVDRSLYSDCKIICKGQEFKVHKIILHCNSPKFEAALSSGLQESQAGATTLPLNDDDPEVLGAMLDFFYTFSYRSPRAERVWLFHLDVFKMAIKHGSEPLRKNASRAFELQCIREKWTPQELVLLVRSIDETQGIPALKEFDDLVLKTVRRNLSVLRDCKEFRQLMKEMPAWSVRLLKAMEEPLR